LYPILWARVLTIVQKQENTIITASWWARNSSCIYGDGQFDWQFLIALPQSLGHDTNLSKKSLQSLTHGKHASNGWRKIQMPEHNPATGQAIKIKRRSHIRA
jgi:hypothetical protein